MREFTCLGDKLCTAGEFEVSVTARRSGWRMFCHITSSDN